MLHMLKNLGVTMNIKAHYLFSHFLLQNLVI